MSFFTRVSCSFIAISAITAVSAVAQDSTDPTKPATVLDEVVVSAPLPRTLVELAQPATVVEGDELREQGKATLGEALSSQPGVTGTGFGPGASRPVIRGLSGDRVRILQDGIGSQDVSNTSPDHAVSAEPLLADRVEIIRGPATLMYGSTAIGGVVNVLDNKIPEQKISGIAKGAAQIRGGTVDNERTGVATLTTGVGPLMFHVEGLKRKTDDLEIPSYARTGARRASGGALPYPEPKGTLPFSATETQSSAIGTSLVGSWGYFGVAGTYFDTTYGVPNGEDDVSIKLRQPRLDVRSKIYDPLPGFSSLTFKFGMVDYKHTEFEGSEVGTKFLNDGLESRLELVHKPVGNLEGVIGFQLQHSTFSALGEEAFQPPTTTRDVSGFIFEEYRFTEKLRAQLGGRADFLRSEGNFERSEAFVGQTNIDRTFQTVSGSTALVFNPAPGYGTSLSVSYTQRPPSAQELYANGTHVATGAVEIGDSTLAPERSTGIDLTTRKENGRVTGFVSGFYNHFDRFISLNPTGEQGEEFPVYKFEAANAQFFGFEGQAAYHFLGDAEEAEDLFLSLQPDYVWAEVTSTSDALPRIPPFRLKARIGYKNDSLTTGAEVMRVFAQHRTAEFETDTGAYTFLNVDISYKLKAFGTDLSLFVRGQNLTDQTARNHVSFIKDVAPLGGRNVMGGLQVSF